VRPPRRRVLKAAQILFDGRSSAMDCTVRWLLQDGAGLALSTTTGLPMLFYLLISADGFDRPCRVIDSADRYAEVLFC
jgi:hypothetical protein